ncbi:MAG: IPT/TIG domain-containing protein [bacterium]
MRILKAIALISLFLAASCGSGDGFQPDVPTDAPPIISRVDPNAGSPGDNITIFGLGFTISYPENIVVIGGAATTATSYRLLDNPTASEVEAITVTVPTGAQLGEGPVYVQVHGNSSNSDVSFTVNP